MVNGSTQPPRQGDQIGRKALVGLAVVVISLVVIALESPGEAALGCFRDNGFSAATCTDDADCAPVGGIACTIGFCFSPNGLNSPFTPCAALPAPALSQRGTFAAAALVCAVGLLGLWRRTRRGRNLA